MEAMVATVPGTGTNWLLMQLLPYYGEYYFPGSPPKGTEKGNRTIPSRLGFCHYQVSSLTREDILNIAEGIPLYTSLRDPALCFATCIAGGPGPALRERIRCWEDLVWMDERRPVVYTPVDLPEVAKANLKAEGIWSNPHQAFNSTKRESAQRKQYDAGDLSYIPLWAMDWLKNNHKLIELLKREGYDLSWTLD